MFFIFSILLIVLVKPFMPFCYEIIAINEASVDSLFQFLFLQSVVIHQANCWFQGDFGFLAVVIHMYMNGVVLVQVEEKPHSESNQKCRHTEFFGKDRYKFLYLQGFCRNRKIIAIINGSQLCGPQFYIPNKSSIPNTPVFLIFPNIFSALLGSAMISPCDFSLEIWLNYVRETNLT